MPRQLTKKQKDMLKALRSKSFRRSLSARKRRKDAESARNRQARFERGTGTPQKSKPKMPPVRPKETRLLGWSDPHRPYSTPEEIGIQLGLPLPEGMVPTSWHRGWRRHAYKRKPRGKVNKGPAQGAKTGIKKKKRRDKI
jgi:hypothetical protein